MPDLTQHQSGSVVKLLVLGDSGTGKTGSLVSLVKAGYKLRILDFDNGLDSLKAYVMRDCQDKAKNVVFETLRDRIKGSTVGPIFEGVPSAFTKAIQFLTKWGDLGDPAKWGSDTVVVLDSLTFMSDAAFNWAKAMSPGVKDPRQWFYTAQQRIEEAINMLTSEAFATNVLIMCHVRYVSREDGTTKGYPNSIGSALSPQIPAYFNSCLQLETSGTGKTLKRQFRTLSSAMIDLKNPVPFKLPETLPIETGLADFMAAVKGTKP